MMSTVLDIGRVRRIVIHEVELFITCGVCFLSVGFVCLYVCGRSCACVLMTFCARFFFFFLPNVMRLPRFAPCRSPHTYLVSRVFNIPTQLSTSQGERFARISLETAPRSTICPTERFPGNEHAVVILHDFVLCGRFPTVL